MTLPNKPDLTFGQKFAQHPILYGYFTLIAVLMTILVIGYVIVVLIGNAEQVESLGIALIIGTTVSFVSIAGYALEVSTKG